MNNNLLLLILWVHCWKYVSPDADKEFTFVLPARQSECFYQTAQNGQYLNIEYQVIDGGPGNLDVNFKINAPLGRILVYEEKKTEGSHKLQLLESGDYAICFDNTFSYISEKIIFFEVTHDLETGNEWDNIQFEEITTETYDLKVQDIMESLALVRKNVIRILSVQQDFRLHEARDRNIGESNFSRVNNWSIIQITIMLLVGMIQVIMIRSLFDDRSRIHKMWKAKSPR